MIFRRGLPLLFAVGFGLLTLFGLFFVAELADLLLSWVSFLAAVALLLGLANLFTVHSGRLFSGNVYSGVLVLTMLSVFAVAVTDELGMTEGGVTTIFDWFQAPLEAALASLLAFFLLFAGYRLLQRRLTGWSVLFILTVIVVMLANTPLPAAGGDFFVWLRDTISIVFVNAGMRGILIGVALGTITLSLRLLVGSERPYSK